VNSTNDYATIKYSSAGVPLWTNRYNGPGNDDDEPNALAVDANNGVIVTGYSTGTGSGQDYTTIKYSSTGVSLWTNRFAGGAARDDEALAVAIDGANNVIVTGYESVANRTADWITIKYSSAGLPLWTNLYDGPNSGDDRALAVAADRNGDIVVAGYSARTNSGFFNLDFVTLKYAINDPFVPPPPLPPFMSVLQVTNGTFRMRVDNVLAPGTLVIQASTDLSSWVPIFTNTYPTNVLFYTDPDPGNYPGRFYRAFQFP